MDDDAGPPISKLTKGVASQKGKTVLLSNGLVEQLLKLERKLEQLFKAFFYVDPRSESKWLPEYESLLISAPTGWLLCQGCYWPGDLFDIYCFTLKGTRSCCYSVLCPCHCPQHFLA